MPTQLVIIAVAALSVSLSGIGYGWFQAKRFERAQEALVATVEAKVIAEAQAEAEHKARLVAEARTQVQQKRAKQAQKRTQDDQAALQKHQDWADADVPADLVQRLREHSAR